MEILCRNQRGSKRTEAGAEEPSRSDWGLRQARFGPNRSRVQPNLHPVGRFRELYRIDKLLAESLHPEVRVELNLLHASPEQLHCRRHSKLQFSIFDWHGPNLRQPGAGMTMQGSHAALNQTWRGSPTREFCPL